MMHRTPPAILSRHQGNDDTFEPFRQKAVTGLHEFGRELNNHVLWVLRESIPPRAPLSSAFFTLRQEIVPYMLAD
jgi:hypothetical protein